ncbi:outer dense fiber protein 2-like [Brachionichthys hirsutus]|uniref:outer dense fiber protein 2-like n=1 Tax=Brachionichthys hirsutus TaxID=412623 RepID=UPI003604972A
MSCVNVDKLSRNSRARIPARTQETDSHCLRDFGKSHFLKLLSDAEAAANAAAVQLVSFKDAVVNSFKHEPSDSRQSAIDKYQITRQKGLLLEKFEDFKQKNKAVRQKLKQLQDLEADRINANHQIGTLMKKVSQAEGENEHLKSDLSVTERRLEELMDLRREEQENLKSAVYLTKSVEAIRVHLQGQLRNREAENGCLTVHIQNLERTLTAQNMKIDELKGCISSLTEKAAQDKEALQKATRAQKLRAERFEAAIEKCYAQLKEKDAQLASARLERDSKRQQKEQTADETNKLAAHVELLKSQIADLTARLQNEKDELTAVNETVMRRVEKLRAENGELGVNNAALKASVTKLQQQLADSESSLVEETAVSQESKHQAEHCRRQIAELQTETDGLRIKYVNLLRETSKTQDGKGTEVEEVRQELQGRVKGLNSYPQLLNAAEQSLFECQENLRSSEREFSEKSESISQLQVQMGSQAKLLRSTAEMRESIHEANLQLQEKVTHLHKQIDKLQEENLELVHRLAAQEEARGYSNRQLDQRSSECQALSRQLEAALSDVKQQVNKVKDQAVSKEKLLQTEILTLEAEKSRRDNELRILVQSKHTVEKQFEVRLKDLQLSLDQSESRKQSVQNYVDFLKNSYKTMFVEGLQQSAFGSSSCFLK